jgi:histidinol dehydrogenase
MKLRRLSTRSTTFDADLAALTRYEASSDEAVESAARSIIRAVRTRGDEAVLEYARSYDRVQASAVRELEIGKPAMKAAFDALPADQMNALREAAQRIRSFHERQLAASWDYTEADGTLLGQKVTPLERVGLYVPGGRAAYPSSVLMNALPARVAGVRELIMASPTPPGEGNALVLAAAHLAGIDRVFAIGGAQAIAALAYGTASVPRVVKIVGPGNAYVAAAKRQVFGAVGIDLIAGPSEILVICDGKTDPEWVALDLFSQAEHDEAAQAVLLSPDAGFIDSVENAVARLLPQMQRRAVIEASLAARGALIEVRDLDDACEVANRIAPEHLELSVEDPHALLAKLRHSGAIFLGRWSSEAIGDYCAGPNHVLPTAGTARFSSPLGVYDFQKRTSVIGVSQAGAQRLGRIAATLAEGEGLQAHARSATARIR